MRVRAASFVLSVTLSALPLAWPGTAAPAHAASCPAPGGAGVPDARRPAAEVVFSGHGWGHGMGMSQYGAQGAARLGCDYRTILDAYYRDTRLVRVSMTAPVQLSLLARAGRASLLAESGTVRWTGGAVQPRGATWTVVRRGAGIAVRDQGAREMAWVPDGTALAASHTGTVVRVRAFRPGSMRATTDLRTRWDRAQFVGTGGRVAVTQLIVTSGGRTAAQKYLYGLAEVPSSWPQQALRAQVVAARTYLAAKASDGAYRLTTTTADQVYRGWAKESTDYGRNWGSAVDATIGQVIVDGRGRGITAMYSSSMGGFTEDRQYVYGSYGIGYLKAVDDSRWDRASDNPYRSWAVGMSRKQLAQRFGFTGVTAVSIAPRGSGERLAGLRVTGWRAGRLVTLTYTGSAARSRLGLRSPGFVVASGRASAAPPAPATTPLQALAGDWDGDGTTDPGWYDNGVATLRVEGRPVRLRFGTRGDVAVAGDWDGDGRDGLAVFRGGRWFLRDRLTSGVADRQVSFGRPGDVPVAGRFGPGPADGLGVVRGTVWHERFTATRGAADRWFTWAGDGAPVVGDWDGDGTDDPGRAGERRFTLAVPAETGASATGAQPAPVVLASPVFGAAADLPLVGDWDGDGKDTTALARDGSRFLWRDDLAGGAGTGTTTFGAGTGGPITAGVTPGG
jgi:stage II sporulation protein D